MIAALMTVATSRPMMGKLGMSTPKKPPAGPPAENPGGREETDVIDRPKSHTPRLYKVIFHNDDYTTQEFVVHVLMAYFHKSQTEATHVMLTVHKKGSGVAGVYTRDIAETKVQQVMDLAREYGMPLLLTTEPE
jgi:ATP-dependent Clp protease adaptor protein ClpS